MSTVCASGWHVVITWPTVLRPVRFSLRRRQGVADQHGYIGTEEIRPPTLCRGQEERCEEVRAGPEDDGPQSTGAEHTDEGLAGQEDPREEVGVDFHRGKEGSGQEDPCQGSPDEEGGHEDEREQDPGHCAGEVRCTYGRNLQGEAGRGSVDRCRARRAPHGTGG